MNYLLDTDTCIYLMTDREPRRRERILAHLEALPPDEIDKKFRLRGINCPEMDTDGGKSARRFVQALIDPAVAVTLITTKPDKYDRYLADVFIETKSGETLTALHA